VTAPIRLAPATAIVHLEFNAGEDVDHEIVVVDQDGQPAPIASAVGTIALPGCPAQHVWSVAAGNLELSDGTGVVLLHTTAEQTRAWAATWGDSEWQLDTVDAFRSTKVVCAGDVRVNPTRSEGEA
jgi:hypothetical protein